MMKNHQKIKSDIAGQLILDYGESIKEVELLEIIEKKFGHGIDDLVHVNGAGSLVPILHKLS